MKENKNLPLALCILLFLFYPCSRFEVRAEERTASGSNALYESTYEGSHGSPYEETDDEGDPQDLTEAMESMTSLMVTSNLFQALNLGCTCAVIFCRYVRGVSA